VPNASAAFEPTPPEETVSRLNTSNIFAAIQNALSVIKDSDRLSGGKIDRTRSKLRDIMFVFYVRKYHFGRKN
jgi:hypothetical protein